MTATDHNNHNMSSSYWTGAPYDSSSDEDLIHLPILPKLPTIPRPYQATVEDCPEDDDSDLFVESDSTASASGSPPPLNRRRSSPNPHQSSSPTPRSSRAGRDHRDGFYAYSGSEDERERGRRQQQQPKPRVHFWDRGPDAPVPSDASNNSSSTQNSSRKRTVNPVEFQWGALFDARYNPTSRVRQVYRAVAKHMMHALEPVGSSILLPCQMEKFYSMFPHEHEALSLRDIFQSSVMDRIEHMYRSLHCEYHLVPRTAGEAPTVPALTEAGFARWMTRLAQACPGAEARRLDSIVTHWRIECPLPSLRRSPGPVPKHLPPTLPRNMFPPHPNIHVEDEVITAYHEARRFRSRSPPRHRRAAATEARRHSARFDSPPPRKKYTDDDEDYERLRRHLRRGGSPPPRRDRDSRRYAYEDHDLEYDVPTRRGKGSKHDRSSTKNSDKRSSRAKGKDRTRDRSPSPSRNRRKDPFSRFFGEGVSNLQPGRHLVEKDRYGRTRYRKLSG